MTTNNRVLPNGLDIKAIDPRQGAKYSPNLYKWLTSPSNKHRPQTSRVYRDADDALWIGMINIGAFVGSRLLAVLCDGRTRTFCIPGLRGLQEVADFWPRYTEVGRCAIDPGHNMSFIGDNRWTVTGDTRNCLWCGNSTQYLHRWTEPVQRGAWLTEPQTQERT